MPRAITPPPLESKQQDAVVENYALAVTTAKKFRHSKMPIEDRSQEAVIGMMRAAQLHRAKDSKFSTYAVKAMVRRIVIAINRDAFIYTPRDVDTEFQRSHDVPVDRMSSKYGNAPKARDADAAQDVRNAIDTLNDTEKTVISEMIYRDVSIKEVSRKLGLHPSTVWYAKHQAFKKLRIILQDYA